MVINGKICFAVWAPWTVPSLLRLDLQQSCMSGASKLRKGRLSHSEQYLKKALCAYWLMATYCSIEAWILEEANWAVLQLQMKPMTLSERC